VYDSKKEHFCAFELVGEVVKLGWEGMSGGVVAWCGCWCWRLVGVVLVEEGSRRSGYEKGCLKGKGRGKA